VNAAADQQRLMPDPTANTWLMTKEHNELLQDEGQNAENGKQDPQAAVPTMASQRRG